MEFDHIYLILFLLIFVINVIPAFMPPTWIVLTFFFTQYHLYFLPTVIIGVIAATSGRIILALIARYVFRPFLPKKFYKNYDSLGLYLKKHQHITIPVVLTYAFSPISSNSLFIVAGLSNLALSVITFSFFIGRIFSYSFWISASIAVAKKLSDIFSSTFSSTEALIGGILSIAIVIILGHIRWDRLYQKRK